MPCLRQGTQPENLEEETHRGGREEQDAEAGAEEHRGGEVQGGGEEHRRDKECWREEECGPKHRVNGAETRGDWGEKAERRRLSRVPVSEINSPPHPTSDVARPGIYPYPGPCYQLIKKKEKENRRRELTAREGVGRKSIYMLEKRGKFCKKASPLIKEKHDIFWEHISQ
ncbi:hypothetical protein NDU88_006517 [Pleurodeles waltl]|uniref:Uncharacterized protein n=1 Tax=Pleurodeles waltl TaxID=8319 RepID=A0AAV7PIN8_PLEWA|nr:hypothetical protein NDU88_006517 [Pleurodeles waltl]